MLKSFIPPCREHVQQDGAYSITSSARASSAAGTVMPSALAVLRLMISSSLVGNSTARSPSFAALLAASSGSAAAQRI